MQQEQPRYYVPSQSKLPILASVSLFLTVIGLGNWLIDRSAGHEGIGSKLFLVGIIIFIFVLWSWFDTVIKENTKGLNSAQLKRSFVWGMSWFIFSEVMFFLAFFGALFYLRNFSLTWLSQGPTSDLLWNGFDAQWPLMTTPDMALNGTEASIFGPKENMANPGVSNWLTWLPFWNTILLLSSSITIYIAHEKLKHGDNGRTFNFWLALTISLGFLFLVLQAEEYIHAYQHLGLTLSSGAYGTTFFMLTGFHGLHVTLGSIMLLVQLMRSTNAWSWRFIAVAALIGAFFVAFNVSGFNLTTRILIVGAACIALLFLSSSKPSHVFKRDDCFGFEASSWYWHFVDVVWLGLFIFVYLMA